MKYNSYSVLEKGGPVKLVQTERAELGMLECRIKVETCGICHSDLHMIDNDWRISSYPLVPGHEIVGTVIETGAMVGHLKIGDRAGVGWQAGACMECSDCIRGDENLCDKNIGTIVGRNGGFAEEITLDSRFAFRIPEAIPSEKASPLLCAGITVYSALHYAGIQVGGNIGVIGMGGLGHLALLFAAKLGNRVTVFTTSEDKAEFAQSLGASEVLVNPKRKEKPSRKLDIIINTAPNDLDWSYYLNLLDSDGTLTFVGVPPSPLSLNIGQLLAKRKKITASPIGGRAIMNEMLQTAADHKIFPIIEVFSPSEFETAIDKVRQNKIRYRAVIDFRK